MLKRVLEQEVMDSEDDARDYDSMDHSAVNRLFAEDFLAFCPEPGGVILDVGTGTAQIPIEIAKRHSTIRIVPVDLAESMLKLASKNIAAAGFTSRITPQLVNGREMPFAKGHFAAVVSNSIIHHIPEPRDCFREIVRVCSPTGCFFVRDLLRPNSLEELNRLVELHAAGANAHQRQLFWDSLHAALSLVEIQVIVQELGFDPATVRRTSDRHWTWAARNR